MVGRGETATKDEDTQLRRRSLLLPIICKPAPETNPRPRLQTRRATHKNVRGVPTEPRIGESKHPDQTGLADALRRGRPFSLVRFFDSRDALAPSGPASPFGRASRTSWTNKRNEPAAQRTNAFGLVAGSHRTKRLDPGLTRHSSVESRRDDDQKRCACLSAKPQQLIATSVAPTNSGSRRRRKCADLPLPLRAARGEVGRGARPRPWSNNPRDLTSVGQTRERASNWIRRKHG